MDEDTSERLNALEARVAGLTQAIAAVAKQAILQGNADGAEIMRALDLCETDLRRLRHSIHATDQVAKLRDEICRQIPEVRRSLGD